MSKKIQKTNAMRLLDAKKMLYDTIEYDLDDDLIDGKSVCNKVGLDPNLFFKTLVARGKDRKIIVFVIPVSKELDLKKAATISSEKNIELVAVKELLGLTGYIRGGCSPIGMKKKYETYTDCSIKDKEKLYISAGKKGLVMGMSVSDYEIVTDTKVVSIVI